MTTKTSISVQLWRTASLLLVVALGHLGSAAASDIFSPVNGFDLEWQIEGDLWQDEQPPANALSACEITPACAHAVLSPPVADAVSLTGQGMEPANGKGLDGALESAAKSVSETEEHPSPDEPAPIRQPA